MTYANFSAFLFVYIEKKAVLSDSACFVYPFTIKGFPRLTGTPSSPKFRS